MLSSNISFIICFVCKQETKIYKNKDSWILSNFHKHFKTHFRELTENIKRKKNSSILNFLKYHKDKPSTSLINENSTGFQCQIPIELNSEDSSVTSQSCFVDTSPSTSPLVTPTANTAQLDQIPVEYPEDALPSQYIPITTPNIVTPISEINADPPYQDFHEGRSTEGESNFCCDVNFPQENIKKGVDRNWKHSFYSRRERTRRKLEKCVSDNSYLTDFFPIVEQIREDLGKYISNSNNMLEVESPLFNSVELSENSCEKKVNTLISLLIKHSGNDTKYKGQRYEKQLKQFCCYLFIIGGKLLYETIHANLKNIIPSFRVIKREIEDNQNITEGKLRFEELALFLEERNYPKNIWISEDQTAINSRIEYDPKSNQIIGFSPKLDSNGMPIVNSFPFNNLQDLKNYFEYGEKSNYIIMAQPLVDQAPAFCLSIYGTCNKFNAVDVEKRWNYLLKTAEKYGIAIEGFSTDGDTRMLKVMKKFTELSVASESDWKYIKNLEDSPLFIQDVVHIGTKLKTVFLKESIELRIGKFLITPGHLKKLIENVSKDKHCLTESMLNSADKMNYDTVEKMADPKVASCLDQHINDSEATVAFLRVLGQILDSFLKKDLTPTERCYKMWHATFFFRIWRNWIMESEFSLTKNFISLNCYTCIELNAHCLVDFMKKCSNQPKLFLPWLSSSQPCEKMFRKLRSLTSTYSTVVNFSVLEVLRRLNRIDLIYKITCDAGK